MTSLVRAEPAAVPALKQWSDEQIEMATRSFAKDCTHEELAVFAEIAQRKGLDPWLGQIVAIKRGKQDAKMIVQETVEGLRAIAERSGLYGGYDGPWWCGPDRVWLDYWDEQDKDGQVPPRAARYLVFRKDWGDRPAPGVATWASNVQMYWDKNTRKAVIVDIWKNRPDEMLAKCAETRALRRAFSKEFAVADISVRDLTDAQIVTLEAKRVGLDDDARHELIAEVTGGRTASSTDLTDDETIEVRQEIARRAAEEEEPADAELVDGDPAPGGLRRITQASPKGTETYYVTDDGERLTREEGERREWAALAGRVKRDKPGLNEDQLKEYDAYRESCRIPLDLPAKDHTLEQLHLLDAWFDSKLGEPF